MRHVSLASPLPGCRPRRRRMGGSSVEYLLILALVVIPLAMLAPMLLKMIATYSGRISSVLRLPLG